jgi:hypothetical protein
MTRSAARLRRALRIENLESRQLLATVSGVVFHDLNGDGTQEVGDAGLPGQTVFLDLDGDSTIDADEPRMLTDANGGYSFPIPPDLVGQNLHVALALPGPVLPTDPYANGRWQNTDNNYKWQSVGSSTENINFNFGLRFVPYSTFQPVGSETLVGDNPKLAQPDQTFNYGRRTIATDDAGNYVTIFARDAEGGKAQINLRVFNADGSARSNEIVVTVAASGLGHTVSMSRDGSRIAVAWMQRDSRGSTAPFVQLLDASGAKLGSPIQTAPFGVDKSTGAPVTSNLVGLEMDNTGNFTVLMNVNKSRANIQFQRYTRAGAVIGKVVSIDAGTIVNGDVNLAMDATGRFLVAWQGTSGILAQRYSATGLATGSRIVIAAEPNPGSISLRLGAVTMNSSGRFAVLWQADAWENPRNVAQAFDANGIRLGGLVSNITLPGTSGWPELATMNAAGDVTFTFVRDGGQYDNGTGATVAQFNAKDVFVRQLSASGILSEPQIVNSTTQGIQTLPSVASTPSGFIVMWLGTKIAGGTGVYTQRYEKVPLAPPTQFAASSTTGNGSTVDYLMAMDAEDPFGTKARNRSSRASATR